MATKKQSPKKQGEPDVAREVRDWMRKENIRKGDVPAEWEVGPPPPEPPKKGKR